MRATSAAAATPGHANYLPQILLACIVLFYLFSFVYWHSLDTSPKDFDQALYFQRAAVIYFQVKDGHVPEAFRMIQEGTEIPIMPLRPVLVPALTAVAYQLFGLSRSVSLLIPVLSTLALLYLCYLTGKKWRGWPVGVLAAFLTLMMPLVAILSRHYYLEIPLALAAMLVVYLLLTRDVFVRTAPSLLTGLVIGIGMWTRENFPLFVIGPLAGYLLWLLVSRNRRGAGALRITANAALAAVLAAGVALPFYATKLSDIAPFVGSVGPAAPAAPGAAGVADLVIAYAYMFTRFGISALYLGIFIIAGALAAAAVYRQRGRSAGRNRSYDRGLFVIVPSVLIPLLAGSIMPVAVDVRYALPAIPAFAILLSGILLGIPWKRAKMSIIGLAIVAGLAQFYALSFAPASPRIDFVSSVAEVHGLYRSFGNPAVRIQRYSAQADALAAPARDDWKRHAILAAIEERRKQSKQEWANVYVVPRIQDFIWYQFMSESVFSGYKLGVEGTDSGVVEDLELRAKKSDYLIVKYGERVGNAAAVTLTEMVSSWDFRATSDRFALPDGSYAVIYEKTTQR